MAWSTWWKSNDRNNDLGHDVEIAVRLLCGKVAEKLTKREGKYSVRMLRRGKQHYTCRVVEILSHPERPGRSLNRHVVSVKICSLYCKFCI